jgi:hypothetical protein
MRKIIDEFTDLGVSPERKRQLRLIKAGLCQNCGVLLLSTKIHCDSCADKIMLKASPGAKRSSTDRTPPLNIPGYGGTIEMLRRRAGISKSVLARHSGLPPCRLSVLERTPNVNPCMKTIEVICSGLGITVLQFMAAHQNRIVQQ